MLLQYIIFTVLFYTTYCTISEILPLSASNYDDVINQSPIIILSSKGAATKHVTFLNTALTELRQQLPHIQGYHYRYPQDTSSQCIALHNNRNNTSLFFKRDNVIIKYRGELVPSLFITFIWINIKEYSVQLDDYNFETTTQVYTWLDGTDWLVQFYSLYTIPAPVWAEVGYKLNDYVSIGAVNITQNYNLQVRFQQQLSNMSLPGVVFFKNRTLYIYKGEQAVDILTEFARKSFSPKKIYKKFFLNAPPQGIPVPPPIYVYSIEQYARLPELYNAIYIVVGAVIVWSIRKYLANMEERGNILMKEEKSE